VSGFELASCGPEHRDDYLALLREAWGPGSMSREEFEWWFERNPAGSLTSVALAAGRVVGVAGHSLFRAVVGGRECVVSFSVHATTHASARGQGIFAELERKHEREAAERGVECVLAFASAPTAPIFLGPLGWTELGRLRVWARPVVRGGAAAAPAVFSSDEDAARTWPNHLVRDGRYLSWRYGDSPRGYVRVDSAGGYAVVWPAKAHRGRTISILADVVAPPGDVRGLLRRAARVCRSRLLFALPGPGGAASYASAGFVPTPMTLHVLGKALAGRLDARLDAWRFTLGDTDFF